MRIFSTVARILIFSFAFGPAMALVALVHPEPIDLVEGSQALNALVIAALASIFVLVFLPVGMWFEVRKRTDPFKLDSHFELNLKNVTVEQLSSALESLT